MARTRGGRERPTASVRRGDKRDKAVEAGGFPGGPSDCSVLVSYPNYIAFRLWNGKGKIFTNFCIVLVIKLLD